jgi:hypothetical protein
MKWFKIMSCLSLVVLVVIGLVVGCDKSADTPTSPAALNSSTSADTVEVPASTDTMDDSTESSKSPITVNPEAAKCTPGYWSGCGLDLNKYCQTWKGNPYYRTGEKILDAWVSPPGNNVYSWYCKVKTQSGTYPKTGMRPDYLKDWNYDEACHIQYGDWTEALYGNKSNPYSWKCYRD